MAFSAVQRVSKAQASGATLAIGAGDSWATPTAGNLLVATANSDATVTMTTSGFTAGPSVVDGNAAYLWWKIAAGTESTITFTPGSSAPIAGTVCEYAGNAAVPFDASNSNTINGSAGTVTVASNVVTTQAGDLIVAVAALHSGGVVPSAPSWSNGFTNQLSPSSGTGTTHAHTFYGDLMAAGAPTTYNTVCTWTSSCSDRQHLIIAFKELVSAGPPIDAGYIPPLFRPGVTLTGRPPGMWQLQMDSFIAPPPETQVLAECAEGTGTADDAEVSVLVAAEAATGTGTADNATVAAAGVTDVDAECATGSGTAGQPGVALTIAAEAATGTGTADNAGPSVEVNAGCATGSGVAEDPTVSVASMVDADAEAATGTGSADQPGVGVAVTAGCATGAGSVEQPTAAVAAAPATVTGTGSAGHPTAAISVAPVPATGTGTAAQPGVTVSVNPEGAEGTGTAPDPTVSTASFTNADAGCATGSGTADNASTAIAATAGQATGTGTAEQPTAVASVGAGLATGTGAANNAAVVIGVEALAGVASGTGTAHDAGVWLLVYAGCAEGAGEAYLPSLIVPVVPVYGLDGPATGSSTEGGATTRGMDSGPATTATLEPAATVSTGHLS